MKIVAVVVETVEEGVDFVRESGLPVLIEPFFTLRAQGRAEVNDIRNFEAVLESALSLSPLHEAIITIVPEDRHIIN